MLFDTSYTDRKIIQQIEKAVGKPFTFKERLKMRGIGSKRMVIQGISEAYQKHLKADHYQTTANIELRPKGIIIHFRDKLQTLSWVMPYDKLTINQKKPLKLSAEEKFILLEARDEAFIKKMINLQKAG